MLHFVRVRGIVVRVWDRSAQFQVEIRGEPRGADGSIYLQLTAEGATDPQKAKLQVLQDAVKLAPVISDAQSGNLIGTSTYVPLFFTSTSTGTTSGSVIGGLPPITPITDFVSCWQQFA